MIITPPCLRVEHGANLWARCLTKLNLSQISLDQRNHEGTTMTNSCASALGPIVPTGLTGRTLGVSNDTVKNMARRGEIEYTITPSGRWLFDLHSYMQKQAQHT